MEKIKILVVDDELSMRQFLKILLKKEGYEVETAVNGEDAVIKAKTDFFPVILMDYNMPGAIDGIELLQEFLYISKEHKVIIITAYSSTDQAIKAIELGAFDYVSKPFNVVAIRELVAKALKDYKPQAAASDIYVKSYSTESIDSKSNSMIEIESFAERIAPTDSTVLITGESGVGKEVLASKIHQLSNRKNGPWFPINCGAIPENLQESMFFGYKKGAFTGADQDRPGYFEVASGGTLFLDEIGELGENMQVKLLRVLQERKFIPVGDTILKNADVRIIAATNSDLRKMIKEGRFREDLFFRLNVFELNIPPLRDRREDILPLAKLFLENFSKSYDKPLKLSSDAEHFLLNYTFKGNVRELRNMLERGSVLSTDGIVSPGMLVQKNNKSASALVTENEIYSKRPDFPIELDTILENIERYYVIEALEKCGWKRAETAKALGINERSLRYRMQKLELTKGD